MHNSTGYVMKQLVQAFSCALSSYGAPREVWRALNKLELPSAIASVVLLGTAPLTNMDYIKKLLHNFLTACFLPHSHETVWLTYGGKTTARVALGYRLGQLLRFFRALQTFRVLHNSIVHAKA